MLGCGKCLCGATQVKCGIKQICAEHSRTHLHKTVECFQHKTCNSTLANTKFYNFMAHSRLGFVFPAIKTLYNTNSSLMDGNVQNGNSFSHIPQFTLLRFSIHWTARWNICICVCVITSSASFCNLFKPFVKSWKYLTFLPSQKVFILIPCQPFRLATTFKKYKKFKTLVNTFLDLLFQVLIHCTTFLKSFPI